MARKEDNKTPLSRAQMIKIIVEEKGSVMYKGEVITSVNQLPSEAELAIGDPVAERVAAENIYAELERLKGELAILNGVGQGEASAASGYEEVRQDSASITGQSGNAQQQQQQQSEVVSVKPSNPGLAAANKARAERAAAARKAAADAAAATTTTTNSSAGNSAADEDDDIVDESDNNGNGNGVEML